MFAHISLEVVVLVLALAAWAVSIMSQHPLTAAVLFLIILGLVLYLIDFPAIRLVAARASLVLGGGL